MDNYTIVLPAQVKPFTDIFMLALTVYREARGESIEGKQAVAWTIRNRVEHPSWYGKDWVDVVTKPVQFTSMVPPKGVFDPNLVCYPRPDEPAWVDCVKAAFDVICSNVPDPTGGATFYFAKSMKAAPAWAATYVHTADIGNHKFYKVPTNGN